MEYNPKISIIVPVYNCEKYLERCLDSIRNQTYENIEVITVDDGSSDRSAEIAKSYAEKDTRFHYYYKENGGVSSTRNFALDRVTGDYIGFVDGDDEILPDMYETLLSLIINQGADVSVISPIISIDGKRLAFSDDASVKEFTGEDAIKESLRGVVLAGHLWSKLFKASLFEELRLREDIAICEDLIAVYEAFAKSEKIVFADLHKYIYYTNSNSAINSTFKESFLTYITATKYICEMVEAEFPSALPYAKSAVVNSYIDVINKLYYAKKLDRDTWRKYKTELKFFATRDVLRLMPMYKRVIANSVKCGKLTYSITIRIFNIMKKMVYLFNSK